MGMKCPNCGAELQFDVYRNMRPNRYPPQFLIFCPNNDFITDASSSSNAITEVESANNWTKRPTQAQMEAMPWKQF